MFKKRTIDEYFDIIKKNHQNYLETQMVTHLDVLGIQNKKLLIDRYLAYIKNYRELTKNDLTDAIRGSTTAENLERGSFSALLGMLLGGLFFAAEQHGPSADLFGAKTAVQGGFAAAIGASCGALIYSTWDMSNEKPAHADFKACEEGMQKAGFTDERYNVLSADLVTLFHFRECLLLGLGDETTVNMRDAFKHRYYGAKNAHAFDEADFNLAIDVYFLEQLNELFHQAFEKIHQIHDKEINDEKQENEFSRWFKRHFESYENRQKFTQQMQFQFIKKCMDFLERQMNQPGFMGSYIYFMDFLAGLITASFAVGIFAAITLFIPVFALISIAIAAASITAIATHLTISNIDFLYYKRDIENRHAISNAIKSITIEQKRLATLLQKVIITTTKDLAELKKYDDNDKSSFLKILKGDSPKQIALGSVRAWIREFTSRYNESKTVVLDLSERITTLINDAHDQTEALQSVLTSWITAPTPTDAMLNDLTQFIKDTKDYLLNPDNAAFIKTFESVQKIKEQVLEIVGHMPFTTKDKPLPAALVNFYTTSIARGGLGGLKSDLDQVRRLAPVVSAQIAADATHPWQQLLTTAFTIQLKLNESPNAELILQGDSRYRNMLGLPSNQTIPIERRINNENIRDYLDQSFDFLCLLNQYETNVDWNGSFQNVDPFILYRMLFVKELANLTDPNNIRVDSLVKDEIKRFARTTLNYNPDVAFDDILNQALLVHSNIHGRTIHDALGNPRLLSELSYIADAVRVDMAYVCSSLSPEQLITLEAKRFLMKGDDKIIFGHNSMGKLTPELSQNFYDKINDTIQVTTAFLVVINTNKLLHQTNTINLYLQVIATEINRVTQLITVLNRLLGGVNVQPLDDVLNRLDVFMQSLTITESVPIMHSQPTAPSHLSTYQSAIDALEAFIKKQNTEHNKEKSSTWLPFLSAHHKHTRVSKIKAAEDLRDVLQTGNWEEFDLNNSLYKTNTHLQGIMQTYNLESVLEGMVAESSMG